MVSRLRSWIGQNAGWAMRLLAIVVVANVCFQFYVSRTTALTPWKGGGFGMYTDPHADTRTVWMRLSDEEGSHLVRLYPVSDALAEMIARAPLKSHRVLSGLTRDAAAMRYYPTRAKAEALVPAIARFRWPESIVPKSVSPGENGAFARENIAIEVHELRLDIHESEMRLSPIFEASGGGV